MNKKIFMFSDGGRTINEAFIEVANREGAQPMIIPIIPPEEKFPDICSPYGAAVSLAESRMRSLSPVAEALNEDVTMIGTQLGVKPEYDESAGIVAVCTGKLGPHRYVSAIRNWYGEFPLLELHHREALRGSALCSLNGDVVKSATRGRLNNYTRLVEIINEGFKQGVPNGYCVPLRDSTIYVVGA